MTPSAPNPSSPSSNGSPPAGKATVRSGLAKKRSPVLTAVRDFGAGLRRLLTRDPLSLFLLLASIGLALAFALLLGSIQPGSKGRQMPLSTVQKLARGHQIAFALLLDHDSRVEIKTTAATPVIRPDGTLPEVPAPTHRAVAKHTRARG